MRTTTRRWMLALTASLLAGALTIGVTARADDELDVAVSGNSVTVTAKGHWHINKDYPWKLTSGDTKLDKSKFTLTETTASVSGVPKGPAKVKGAVCSGDQCKNFEKAVTIQ